ncbi:MAG: 2-isopropylmalate synthase [Planctomycetota bacterium]
MSEKPKDNVIIFDSTLRDGEQSPGATMNTREKVEIARHLEQLGVDVIEAGFPMTSTGDFEAVQAVGRAIQSATICGLARCVQKDVVRAGEALAVAKRGRLHVFLATSNIHMKYQLRKEKPDVLKLAVQGVRWAREFADDVEFSPMDASRTDFDFLKEVVEAAIDAGARTVNIPDTVGYAVPQQFHAVIRRLLEEVPNISRAVLSVHCHNDLGLAVANSLAALLAGARQVECTINGLGERAGNCSLEEVVMAVRTRADFFPVKTRIRTERLYPTSRLVSSITGLQVQRNKAIVGENAFAHESGVHVDGILKERTTYEIMRPEDVGFVKSRLVLGKTSGRHLFVQRTRELGYDLSEDAVEKAFDAFKRLTDLKKEVYDEEIEAVIGEVLRGEAPVIAQTYELKSMRVQSATNETPRAEVALLSASGQGPSGAGTGDGPVDAVFRAIESAVGLSGTLKDYSIRAVTVGKDAMGEAQVEVEFDGSSVRGRAVSTDVIEASAKAYLNAINRHLVRGRAHPEGFPLKDLP